MAVFRRFLSMICGALFALVLSFVSANAVECPEYSSGIGLQPNGPAWEEKLFGDSYDFNQDGKITIDECITTHVYGSAWMDILFMYLMGQKQDELYTASTVPASTLNSLINISQYSDQEKVDFYTRLVKKYASSIDLMFKQQTYPALMLAKYVGSGESLSDLPSSMLEQLQSDVNARHVAGFSICRYNEKTGNYDTDCTPIIQVCNQSDLEDLDYVAGTTQVVDMILYEEPRAFSLDIEDVFVFNECSCSAGNGELPDEFCPRPLCPRGYTRGTGEATEAAYNFAFDKMGEYLGWGCAPIQYRVYLNGNGGNGSDEYVLNEDHDSYLEYGNSYTLPLNSYTKTGYNFTGWNTESNGSGTSYSNGATIQNMTTVDYNVSKEAIQLYAQWVPKQYTINLYQNANSANDTVNSTITVTYDASMPNKNNNNVNLTAPTRNGYAFKGYYSSRTSGTQYYNSSMNSVRSWNIDSANSALYAQWTLSTYYITYDGVEGATNNNPTTYNVESATITINEPTKTGYTFLGWCDQTNPNCNPSTTSYTIPAGSTGDKTLYAKWTPDIYTVSYSCGDEAYGDAPQSATVSYDSTYTPSENTCTKSGYTFAGWSVYGTEDIKTAGTEFTWLYTDSKTLTATWDVENFIVEEQTATKNMSEVQEIQECSANGYTLSNNTCTPTTYTITYNLNGGTNNANNPASYTIESQTITFANPSKSGVNFGGWYTDSGFTTPITQIKSGSTGNKTLYAKWVSPGAYTCPTGYTSDFAPSKASDCYYDVNATKYISYSPLDIDVSINGFGQNGNMGYKTTQYETDPLNTITEENTWYFNFSYGALYGDSACRPNNDPYGTWNTVSDTDFPKGNQNNGSVCWCRLNSDNDPGLTGVGYKSKWVARGYVDSGDCWKDCAYDCSQIVGQVYGWSDDIRPSMLNNITLTTSSCPAGYYCPGGKVFFGNDGKFVCPAHSTSSAGAATCTCDSGWATADGNGATNENPCYKICSVGQYSNNGTCVSCPTGYTTTTTYATSIYDCVISSQPGNHLVPDADAATTGGYTYFKDGSGYSPQSEFASAQSNSWKDFFDYGNLSGRAACSDIWAEYGTISDVNFDPTTWYGQNCWCDIEQYGDCTVDNRTDCSNDNTNNAKSKWVSFGYVENDRCWQDCAGKCANAMEQNATMRTNALSTITLQSVTCPAGYYCPNTTTVSYGNVTISKIECPSSYPMSAPGTSSVSYCYKDCSARSGYTVTGVDYYGNDATDTCSYTPNTYTITYVLNGGTLAANAPTSYTVGNTGIILPEITKTGYSLEGWMVNELGENAGKPGDSYTPTLNITLVAKWIENDYVVTYSCGDGEIYTVGVSATEYARYDQAYEPRDIYYCAKDGYTFAGWTVSNTNPTEIKAAEVSFTWNYTEDKTFTAQWTPNSYSIDYVLEPGATWPNNQNHPSSANYDEVFNVGTPELSGWNFNKWNITNIWSSKAQTSSNNSIWGYIQTGTYNTSNRYFKNLREDNGETITFTARWSKTCSDGTYYNATTQNCTTCPAGSYCYNVTGYKDDVENKGIRDCPTGYTSGNGAQSQNECYMNGSFTTTCADLYAGTKYASGYTYTSGNSSISCKKYYGYADICVPDNIEACKITGITCGTGYTATTTNSSSLSDVNKTLSSTDWIVKRGEDDELVCVNEPCNNNYDLIPNAGELYAWFDYGRVHVNSLCASVGSTNVLDLSDTTPNTSGTNSYCWCNIDSLNPTSGATQSYPSSWIYVSDYHGDTDKCEYICIEDCSGIVRQGGIFRNDFVRLRLYNTTNTYTCTPNTYTVTLNDNGGTGGVGAVVEVYGEEFYFYDDTQQAVRVAVPTKDGYTFTGYYDQNASVRYIDENGDILVSNTTFTQNTTLYAQWTQCGTGEIAVNNACVCDSANNYYGTAGSCNVCNVANGYTWANNTCSCVSPKVEDNGVCHTACGANETWNGSACVCDEASYYYGTAGSCENCDPTTGQTWDGSACVCDSANNYYGTAGSCENCDPTTGQTWNGSACVSICGDGETWDGAVCIGPQTQCESQGGDYHWNDEIGECEYCDSTTGQTWDGYACVCDEANYYYGTAGSCQYCDTSNGQTWNGSACIDLQTQCESQGEDYHWILEGQTCEYCDTSSNSDSVGYYWDGSACQYYDCFLEEWDPVSRTCVTPCPSGNYTRSLDGTYCYEVSTGCRAHSSSNTINFGDLAVHFPQEISLDISTADYIEFNGTGFDFNNNGTIDANECYVARINTDDASILDNENLTDADVKNANVNIEFCKWNPNTNNYDLSCTQRTTVCTVDEGQTLVSGATTAGATATVADWLDLTQSDLANINSLFQYTPATAPLYDRCTTTQIECPTHSLVYPYGPALETAGQGFDFNDDGEITLDECFVARAYSSGMSGVSEQEARETPTGEELWNLYEEQGTWDGNNDLNNNMAAMTFCRYNEDTGNYDGNCTPAVNLCNDNEMRDYLDNTDATTLSNFDYIIDLVEEQLGMSLPTSYYDQLFTESSDDITLQDRCGFNTGDDDVCPQFSSTFTAMPNGPAWEQQLFGTWYDFNGDGIKTIDECITTKVYGSAWWDFVIAEFLKQQANQNVPYSQLIPVQYKDPEKISFFTGLLTKYNSGISSMFTQQSYSLLYYLSNYMEQNNISKDQLGGIFLNSIQGFSMDSAYAQVIDDVNGQHVAGFSICRYNTDTGNYDTDCTPIIQACNISDLRQLDAIAGTTRVVDMILNEDSNAFSLGLDDVFVLNQCSCDASNDVAPDDFCESYMCPEGWIKAPESDFNADRQENTISAIWGCAPIEYSVYLNKNGGSGYNTYVLNNEGDDDLLYGTGYTLPTNDSTKTGYNFIGWNTEYDGSGTSYVDGATIKNMTTGDGVTVDLYAQWTPKKYTVNLNQNANSTDNTINTSIEATYNASMPNTNTSNVNLTVPTRSGYTFKGYYSQRTGGIQYYNANMNSVRSWDMDSANPVLYAQWNPITYYISYDGVNGATNNNPTTYNVDTATITINEPVKTGYTFIGWCDETNPDCEPNTTDYTIPTGSTGDKTLYAKWIANVYTVTYACGDGATGDAPADATATYASGFTPAANTCTKLGYTFSGWAVSDTQDVKPAGTEFTWNYTESKTLTAVWTEIICPANAHKESGECVCDTGYNNGLQSEISTSETASYVSINNSGNFNSSGATHEQSYYGINDNNTWAVDYGNNGMLIGQARCSTRAGADDTLTYTYIDIDNNFVNDLGVDDETGQNGAIYCYCKATEYKPVGQGAQSVISPWGFRYNYSDESSCASRCASTCMDSMSGSNLSYNANFRKALLKRVVNPQACVPSTYAITYNLDGGTNYENAPTTYTYGVGATINGTPTKENASFAGWCTDSALTQCSNTQTISTTSTSDITLYAKWGPAFVSKFELTTSATDTFSFKISAAGNFAIDWGDGIQYLDRTGNTTETTITHNYSDTAARTIRFNGLADGYTTNSVTAAISFSINPTYSNGVWSDSNAAKITSVSGSLGSIFPDDAKFCSTFAHTASLTSVPNTLFTGSAVSDEDKFFNTFAYSGITSVPVGLFPAMSSCDDYMYENTFYASQLATIPSGFNFGLNACSGSIGMFSNTFANTKITTIPVGLFAGVTNFSESMFEATFANSSLTTIPQGFTFSSSTGNEPGLFRETFKGTQISSIPADLFADYTDVDEEMFAYTFAECKNLTSLPENMFANLDDADEFGFQGTFSESGLQSLPRSMFPRLDTTARSSMFESMFADCEDLSGYIPHTLFATVRMSNNQEATDIMNDIFSGDDNLWTSCEDHGMTQFTTGFEDAWDGHVSCIDFDPTKDLLIKISDTDYFQFAIGAAGNFVIDWGDGQTTTINNKSVGTIEYEHNYDFSGDYYVRISGRATGYLPLNTLRNGCEGGSEADITFGHSCDDVHYDSAENITEVQGTLGYMFTNINGRPAVFAGLFANTTNLQTVPAGLFNGITGSVPNMFRDAFEESGITSIPFGLFSGISGTPKEYMFYDAFRYCRNLTAIPADLISGLSGVPEYRAFNDMFRASDSITHFEFENGCPPVVYIPKEFYENLDDTGYDSSTYAVNDMFTDTELENDCPANTIDISSDTNFYPYFGYKSDNDKLVSCVPTTGACTGVTATVNLIRNYDTNDNTSLATLTAMQNTTLPDKDSNGNALTIPTREEYTFAGYYDARSDGTQYISADLQTRSVWTSANNGNLYAHWTPNAFTITLNDNGGNGGTGTIYEKYSNGFFSDSELTTSVTSVSVPTRSGYDFMGYYNQDASVRYIGENGNILATNTTFNDNVTLYAQWGEIITGGDDPVLPEPDTPSVTFCPRYEDTPAYDPEHYKPIGAWGSYPANSYYYYYYSPAGRDNKLAGCQLFYAIDNTLVPHTKEGMSGYTHTMFRSFYNPETGNYEAGTAIQYSGVSTNVALHCADGYSNKQAGNGMIWYSTLVEARENACTVKNPETTMINDVEECPFTYPNADSGATSLTQCYATVSFVTNGGSSVESVNINYSSDKADGYSLSEIPVTTKDNYDFVGWYDNEDMEGEPITIETVFDNGNQVLYANWEESEFNITYMDGTSVMSGITPSTYTYGTGATINARPTKEHGTFVSWCIDPGLSYCAATQTISPSDTGNKTYYAKFTCDTGYTNHNLVALIGTETSWNFAAVNGNGSFLDKSINGNNREQSFYGLTDNNTWALYYEDISVMLKGRASCSARPGLSYNTEPGYPPNYDEYPDAIIVDDNIVYDLEDKTGQSDAKYCYCNVTGYRIDGKKAKSVYAPWIYSNYQYNSAEKCADNCAAACIGGMFNVSSYDYNFRSAILSAATVDGLSTSPTICVPDTYTVTYEINYDGGTNPADATYTVGGSAITLPAPTREGYTLDGWYTASNGGTKVTSPYTPSSDITLYAHWTKIGVDITFYCDNTKDVEVTGNSLYYGDDFEIPTIEDTMSNCSNYNGYSLNRWDCYYENNNGIAATYQSGDAGQTKTANFENYVYCIANWTPNIYNITYMDGGVELIGLTPSTYTYGTGATINAQPTKEHGTFDKWCLDAGLTNCANTQTISASDSDDKTYYAKFTCNTGYTYNPGAADPDLMTVIGLIDTGSYACLSNAGESGDNRGVSEYGLTENGTFVIDYGVKGMLSGRSRCSTREGNANTWANNTYNSAGNMVDTLPDATGQNCYCQFYGYTPYGQQEQTIKTPWIFQGKYENCDKYCANNCGDALHDNRGTPQYDALVTVAFESVESTASSCDINTYTITYNLNGGTNFANAPTEYTVTTPTITLGIPTRTGYVFSGWYTNSNLTGSAVDSIQLGSTGNKEFWAKWTQCVCNTGTGVVNNSCTVSVENNKCVFAWTCNMGYASATQSITPNTTSYTASCTACTPGTYAAETGMTSCLICPENSYSSTNAATSCTPCLEGYLTSGETAADHNNVNDCKIKCRGGYYLAEANDSECSEVGEGYWAPESEIIQGQTGTRNSCPSGERTAGYGAGADDQYDCGQRLRVGNQWLWLKSKKATNHALAVLKNSKVYYGLMGRAAYPISGGEGDFLKTRYDNKQYYIFDELSKAKVYDAVFTLTKNISLGTKKYGYLSNDGTYKSATSTYNLVDNGTWGANYEYGILLGESSCSETSGTNNTAYPDLQTYRDSVGSNCYCRLNKVGDIRVVLNWVKLDSNNIIDNETCSRNCASVCVKEAARTAAVDFRRALFSGVEQEQHCDSCLPGTGAYCELTDDTNCEYDTYCLTGYHDLTGEGTSTPSCTGNSYTISYNANGGSGTMSSTSATYGQYVSLRSNSFTKSGSSFAGWSTNQNASTIDYTNGANVINLTTSNNGTVVLYAVWSSNQQPTNTSNYDDSIAGTKRGYLSNDGTSKSSQSTYGLTVNGTWGVTFSYGMAKGESSCNTTTGITNTANSSIVTSTTDNSGTNCWCRLTNVDSKSEISDWVFNKTDTSLANCKKSCAKYCSDSMKDTRNFRTAIYGSL